MKFLVVTIVDILPNQQLNKHKQWTFFLSCCHYWMTKILPKNRNSWSMEEQYHHFCSIRYQSGWLTHSILERMTGNLLITHIPISQWYPTIQTIGWIPWNVHNWPSFHVLSVILGNLTINKIFKFRL